MSSKRYMTDGEMLAGFLTLLEESLGLTHGAGPKKILAKIKRLMKAARVTEKQAVLLTEAAHLIPAELCPDCSDCQESLPGKTIGCRSKWDDMTLLNDIIEDGKRWGDEDEIRACDCGVAWIAVRCDGCRREYNRMCKGDEAYHAAAEDAI